VFMILYIYIYIYISGHDKT